MTACGCAERGVALIAGKSTARTGEDGESYVNLKPETTGNILESQGYRDKSGALDAIASVRAHATGDANLEKGTSSGGKGHFSLKAANQQINGHTQASEGKRLRYVGIVAMAANVPRAERVEHCLRWRDASR